MATVTFDHVTKRFGEVAAVEMETLGDIYIDDGRINDAPPKDRDIAICGRDDYAAAPGNTR